VNKSLGAEGYQSSYHFCFDTVSVKFFFLLFLFVLIFGLLEKTTDEKGMTMKEHYGEHNEVMKLK